MNKTWLTIECICLFIALPLMMSMLPIYIHPLVFLWTLAGYCYWQMPGKNSVYSEKPVKPTVYQQLGLVGICLVIIVLFWLLTKQYLPSLLWVLPKTNPRFYCVIMVLYPLLSVWPQGMVYRVFFCRRYQHLFTHPGPLLLAAAIAFSMAHLVMHNAVASLLSFLGGLLLTHTYLRWPQSRWADIQHVILGDSLFSIGLGAFFYHGYQPSAMVKFLYWH